ncbi:hypothetical protein C8R44DRAFT_793203 [Mycena epipterygia]|nr:hypothetical protein C8R44DRAFT_793203 [Mycena epipterygia]
MGNDAVLTVALSIHTPSPVAVSAHYGGPSCTAVLIPVKRRQRRRTRDSYLSPRPFIPARRGFSFSPVCDGLLF